MSALEQACLEAAGEIAGGPTYPARAKTFEILVHHLRPLWEAQQERERRLVEALGEIEDMTLEIGPGADLEADENDPSPDDAIAHVAGLMVQKIRAVLRAYEEKP